MEIFLCNTNLSSKEQSELLMIINNIINEK
jgi:hypothetical protein